MKTIHIIPVISLVMANTKTCAEGLPLLEDILRHRKKASPDLSYVASLFHGGKNKITAKITAKITEESQELVEAYAKCPDNRSHDDQQCDIIHETADLLFHVMVLLAHENIALNQVLGELERRPGLNGIEEKMTRNRAQ